MARATKAKARRRQQATPPPTRPPWIERSLYGLLAIASVGAVLAWRSVGGGQGAQSAGAGPVHVHGLGINPADGALFVATHTGLFRVRSGESKATRVGDSFQDTMGFTVVRESQFLGSGHPDRRTDLPSRLGLIASSLQAQATSPRVSTSRATAGSAGSASAGGVTRTVDALLAPGFS